MISALRLRTEYLKEPLGIDICKPRLMWNVEGAKKQTAYIVKAVINGKQSYESQKLETDAMHFEFPWSLSSRDCVEWKVLLFDEEGHPGEWSAAAHFEMGLLNKSDWKARWITGNYKHDKSKKVRYPVDYFQKTFGSKGKIRKARMYITANGLYEAFLNDQRIGDQYFTPGCTNYDVRTQYQVYDLNKLMQQNNRLEIALADGWYVSKSGAFDNQKIFGYETKLLVQIELEYEDQSVDTIVSDNSFAWSNDGAIRYADLKEGEIVDARMKPSLSGKALETEYQGRLCASNNVAVKEKEHLIPKVLVTPNGQQVLDFGQNIAGYIEFRVHGTSGQKVTLIMGETLDENGNFTAKNMTLGKEYTEYNFQRIEYICNGKEENYKPKFAFQGFQYALVLDWPGEMKPEDFQAIALYSDLDVTAKFECSDSGVQKIVENTLWSMKGNYLEVPTDCPTRERAGWTGDAQLFFNTGSIFMDHTAFFRKWMRDIRDEQAENGLVYNINPRQSNFRNSLTMEGSSGWCDADILITYRYWKRYGDDALMREQYESMVKCAGFLLKRLGKYNIFSFLKFPRADKHRAYIVGKGRHFGEWSEPKGTEGKLALLYPRPEEASAYLAYSLEYLSEMADHLGKNKDAERYKKISRNIKKSYQHYFVTEDAMNTERMAKLVRPIALDMVDAETKKKLADKLVKLVRKRNHKIGTGFLSTPFLLGVLSEYGYKEDAWKMLTQPENPGWMCQVLHGATTVWEDWTPGASLNHYSKGACCEWLFEDVCGIKTDHRPNYFMIQPMICKELANISLEYQSVYGTVKSGWTNQDGKTKYFITIPDNCEADIRLPEGQNYHVGAGVYQY